uniref:uncharacterized protein LOC117610656 isoform X2 n=1 Tax=Osmia lignaria TaxID=473952 RepID=UPI001478239D|nr:uncharacterized protein LOC117610656 isoform X2 [Osmia lignaria]XP_034194176.1 uncharacterized protein LOC117610656 isoform X2 [Osmia lignaria]XP_034194177.1 uncharacterized protein LOC117610656 isoform X2 [Osmia lignaria]XP_034194178.1 uncharacterized protein LOC117610656 isoform X2 [Osmia lignaria]
MERFLNIDWKPPLEDILDNTFFSAERLEKESVMYRIMNGNFIDPFKGIEEDYNNVDINLIKSIDPELNKEDTDNEITTNDTKKESQLQQKKDVKPNVPGITKPIFRFPKKSKLNAAQHAMCLRVLLRFSEADKPKLTPIEREELQTYLNLQHIISQEQDEFIEFAKSKWHERSFKITCEDYVNLRWKSKLRYIYKLPRYYSEVTNVPFIANKNIEVKFISLCLQMGEFPKIILPSSMKPYKLCVTSQQLRKRFPPEKNLCSESSVPFKLPVSEDPNCQELTGNNNVDLVISSSGLNCLVNNIDPSYSNSWILPLVMKRHNDKNTIYIDKPPPPIASNVPDKNNWVYKYILRYFLIDAKHQTTESIEGYDNNVFNNINCEELLKFEEYENNLTQIYSTLCSRVVEKDNNIKDASKEPEYKNDIDSLKNMSDCKTHSSTTAHCNTSHFISNSQDTQNKTFKTNLKGNISYKLFTIGPQLSEQNGLMKNVAKEYRMLVRTKTDGFEILENKVQRLLMLTPKLEYQADLGAEAVTLEESLKQWVSLIFRPHTSLARVRISAKTSEILQVEHRTAMSINNEIKRLYNIKVDNSLTILHNIIQYLQNLAPGRYIMRHTVRNGAFATIYKEVENTGKNIFDLHTMYGEEFFNLPNTAWIPLDKTIPTPMHKFFERMPAMFSPLNNTNFTNNKKTSEVKQTNTRAVRRSLRNKQKKIMFHDDVQ